ncbi:MAG: ribosome silencing factor [Nitratiruptor sp.]|nr:ribosome silencing factor [Nitratiruptor sp.]NPA83056.1 ribosome silencing factor [Campylobacterota bacterium]
MIDRRVARIKEILEGKKGEDVAIFDMTPSGYFVDRVVIATSSSDKHTAALLDSLKEQLKPEEEFLQVDASDEWIVVDLGDILVHLMTQPYRQKYQIEAFLRELLGGRSSEST